jgi:hypothetical protein
MTFTLLGFDVMQKDLNFGVWVCSFWINDKTRSLFCVYFGRDVGLVVDLFYKRIIGDKTL